MLAADTGLTPSQVRRGIVHLRASGVPCLCGPPAMVASGSTRGRRDTACGPEDPSLGGREVREGAGEGASRTSITDTSRYTIPATSQPLDWGRSNRDDAGQATRNAAGPTNGDRVVPCSWRKTPQPGPMPLADDTGPSMSTWWPKFRQSILRLRLVPGRVPARHHRSTRSSSHRHRTPVAVGRQLLPDYLVGGHFTLRLSAKLHCSEAAE